jgi:hypothetical protein
MKIGKDITDKKTAGLNAKESQDFEKFVKERRSKKIKEEEEEKITSKMPDNEGDATDADLARQTEELVREKNAFNARHNIPIDDIESE